MIPARVKINYSPYRLVFKEPAGTSRGVLTTKLTYFLRVSDIDNPGNVAYGEVPYFEGLSAESRVQVETELKRLTGSYSFDALLNDKGISSLNFGCEQVVNCFENSQGLCFPSGFTSGDSSIQINGLIWMGNFTEMLERVKQKLRCGFKCIKIKIGAIDWQEELKLIQEIRRLAGDEVVLRVDANGAFTPSDCMKKLHQLAHYGVHSIEQPIKSGQKSLLKEICRKSPIPVALDEELIGMGIGSGRDEFLDYVAPRFIVLKPPLCHGFKGAVDWIERAEKRGIGWWITSALESNVGLDAIAQFTGKLNPEIPQGLGTGNLYTNNFQSPLSLSREVLTYTGHPACYSCELEKLEWL